MVENERYMIMHADVLDGLRLIPDASCDAMLTDPPAGISFMSKDWDSDKGGRDQWIAWLTDVMREALRVLRPGAHALVWAIPRTSHWTATAIENAGFEIRDVVTHIFGSGFPKSLDVSKAIDAHLGVKRPVIGTRVLTGNAAISTAEKGGTYGVAVGSAPAKTIEVTGPATVAAERFNGYGTALKPGSEHWILCRKPLEKTVAATAIEYGTGGINVNGCRIGRMEGDRTEYGRDNTIPSTPSVALGAFKECTPYNPHDEGRWPANLVVSHLPECRPIGTIGTKTGDSRGNTNGKRPGGFGDVGADSGTGEPNARVYGNETIEKWDCPPWCPVATLDAQSGDRPGMNGGGVHRNGYEGGMFGSIDSSSTARADSGGASRFFTTFHYFPKPSRAEREFGCEQLPERSGADTVDREEGSAGIQNPRAGAGRTAVKVHNHHPTIKSVAQTEWMATLLIPPPLERPRRIVVPFAGSGGEMLGAYRAGWEEIVGIERESEFVEIARARLARWAEVPKEMSVSEAVGEARTEKKKIDPKQTSMF